MSDNTADAGKVDWLLDKDLRPVIADVEAAMLAAVASDDAAFDDIARWLIGAGGKRLRPILLLLAARGSFEKDERAAAVKAAAAIELIHVASLYHDDVMDRADRRRGAPSVNRRWTSPIASFAGSFILARAIGLLDGISSEAARIGGEHCAALCVGQLREAENAYNVDWAIEEHLAALEGKTAELFVLATAIGSLLAERPAEEKQALLNYSRNLGLAFQLRDDVLDYTSSTAALGKSSASDLRQGTYTMPVLYSLRGEDADADELRSLLRLAQMHDDDVARAIVLVQTSGAVEETAALAREKSEAAIGSISVLEDTVLRGSLANLARLSVERAA